jgi:mannose-1-phosphate guanylyltransferase
MESAERRPDERWGIILAGGEGTRLRSLTRAISGDDRPKQFCPLLNGETLLDRTRRRVALSLEPERTLVVLTRHHEAFYAPLLEDAPAARLLVQPASRGTAPAILYGVLRVAETAPLGAVAVFPSDHYVSDEAGFMAHVEAALSAVEARPDLVILLGIQADRAEVQYGWVEPGDSLLVWRGHVVRRVRRFWEKPGPQVAEDLLERGCLWNSFVMAARVPAFLALIRGATPELYDAFLEAWSRPGARTDGEPLRALYRALPTTSFSETVLECRPANLAVLPVRGIVWSDWGEPSRVLSTLARLGVGPAWAESTAAVGG